jgi:hypothetical protein
MTWYDNHSFLVVMDLQEVDRGPSEGTVMEFAWRVAFYQNDLNLLPGYLLNAGPEGHSYTNLVGKVRN